MKPSLMRSSPSVITISPSLTKKAPSLSRIQPSDSKNEDFALLTDSRKNTTHFFEYHLEFSKDR